jgi:tetratricopeptide (TPR) repeat protein
VGRDVRLDRAYLRITAIACGIALASLVPALARADVINDCYSGEYHRQISGCTALIDDPATGAVEKSHAYSTRALAHSMRSLYGEAISDYDNALILTPNAPIALNNRAWAYFRWGKAAMGTNDIEQSIRLSPLSGASFDTRAHIRQALGNPEGAMADYDQAMRYGGQRMIKMYQCGLTQHGMYKGPQDGVPNAELRAALRTCAMSTTCDPLPADEECRNATS